MMFSNYQFRFSILGTILGLIGVLVFSGLGTWQVFRAIEKQQLQQDMNTKIKQEVVFLDRALENIESKKYSKVEAVGRYDQSNEILIDNIIHNGVAGYHVLTPFVLKQDKSVIIVNRGWVPLGRDRSVLPVIDSPEGELIIHGTISPPKSKPPLILGELDTKTKVWLYFDKEKFEKKAAYSILPMIVLLSKDDKFGYLREWPRYEEKVAMHIGYAIQWYVFALIVLATYVGVNFKKIDGDNIKDE